MNFVNDVWDMVRGECEVLGLNDTASNRVNFQRLWLPLAVNLKNKPRPFIQGILAPQGTGKTTLTTIVRAILNHWGVATVTLSIDDLYKTYAERQELLRTDPRLIWRGPPGTHDIDSGMELIADFKGGKFPLSLPRFDKSLRGGQGDRVAPVEVGRADILLFEGWFLGTRPVDPEVFARAPAPILSEDEREFARDCNRRLHDYQPLWRSIDDLLILYPLDYRFSLRWRQEAERKMRLAGKSGMSDAEVEQFVKYFWRALHPDIFLEPLLKDAATVVEVRGDRSIGEIRGII